MRAAERLAVMVLIRRDRVCVPVGEALLGVGQFANELVRDVWSVPVEGGLRNREPYPHAARVRGQREVRIRVVPRTVGVPQGDGRAPSRYTLWSITKPSACGAPSSPRRMITLLNQRSLRKLIGNWTTIRVECGSKI